MGLFDWLSGGSAPKQAQSENRALQKQANRLETKSIELHHDTHAVNPFSQYEVQQTRNSLQAHRAQVENFRNQPSCEDFLVVLER